MGLADALEALDRGDLPAAIATCLAFWRDHRHPDVAAVLDGLSGRLPPPTPIRGKTVGARRQAWTSLCERDDPADLPALLPMLWPKTWQAADDMILALRRRRHDPRLTRPVAAALVERTYRSRRSAIFFRKAVFFLEELGDRRALDEGWLGEGSGSWEVNARRVLEPMEIPPLAPADADALGALQRRLAPDRDAEEERDALLAAVYARPDDRVARAIYADHLTAHEDPRGAFIAAQLADTSKSRRAAKKLLDAAGDTWIPEPMARAGSQPVFGGGFVEQIDLPTHVDPAAVTDPCWSTLRDVAFQSAGWDDRIRPELSDLPWFRGLDAVWGLRGADLTDLPDVRWRTLGLQLAPEPLSARPLPTVETLLVTRPSGPGSTPHSSVLEALRGPLGSVRTLRLRFEGFGLRSPRTGQVWPVGRPLDVDLARIPESVDVLQLELDGNREPAGFAFRYSRSRAGGPFDTLDVSWHGPGFRVHKLVAAPTAGIQTLRFHLPARRWTPGDIRRLDHFVSAFDVQGPWPWSPKEELPLRGEVRDLRIDGTSQDDVAVVWEALSDRPFGYAWDGLSVNQGVVRRLKKDPLAHARLWLDKPATRTIQFVSGGHVYERAITLRPAEVTLHTDGFTEPGFVERYLTALDRLFRVLPFRTAAVEARREYMLRRPLHRYGLQVHTHGWLTVFSRVLSAHIPDDLVLPEGVASLELGGCRAFRFGPGPADLVSEEVASTVSDRLMACFERAVVERIGCPWEELIDGTLGVLADQGWRVYTSHHEARLEKGRQRVRVELWHPLEEAELHIRERRATVKHLGLDGPGMREHLEDLVLRLS